MLPTGRLVVATCRAAGVGGGVGGGVDVADFPDTKPAQPAKRAKVSDSMMTTAEPTQSEGERIQSATFRLSLRPRACSARLFGCVGVPAPSIRRGLVKSGAEHILDVRLLASRRACAHRFMAIIWFLSLRFGRAYETPPSLRNGHSFTLAFWTSEMEEIA